MKKITVFAVGVMMSAMLLTACGGSSSSQAAATTSSKPASTATSSAAVTSSAATTSSVAAAADPKALTAADLANPTKTVAYGDFEAMQTTGEVVSIEGEVINFAKGMSYSIGEKDPNAGSRVGTTFVIVGAEEDAYPKDTTHVKFTGKVFFDEDAFSFKLYTLPEYVEVVE